jgi:hypothetical protein
VIKRQKTKQKELSAKTNKKCKGKVEGWGGRWLGAPVT